MQAVTEATGFEPAISALTGLHVRPLHHASRHRPKLYDIRVSASTLSQLMVCVASIMRGERGEGDQETGCRPVEPLPMQLTLGQQHPVEIGRDNSEGRSSRNLHRDRAACQAVSPGLTALAKTSIQPCQHT